jgi:Zn-finger nucleic acid-binding protein
MNCPKCRHELAENTLEGIPIHACSSCNGIWFDRERIKGYLGEALQRSGQSPVLATLREIDFTPTDLVCPACQLPSLESIKPHGVEIEQCTGCRGVFLDPGEIDLLSLQSISDAVDRRSTEPTPLRPLSGKKTGLGEMLGEGASEVVHLVLELLL